MTTASASHRLLNFVQSALLLGLIRSFTTDPPIRSGARRSDRQLGRHHGPTPAMMKRALANGQGVAMW